MSFSMKINPNKTYGLVIPKKKQEASVPKPMKLFTDVEEVDESANAIIAREQADQRRRMLAQAAEQQAKALAEDPTVYDYDAVYDSMQQGKDDKELRRQQKKEVKKPQYIQAILETTKKRQIEQDIGYEKKLAKDRVKEDHLYGDKEKFVTSAYKKKLKEQEEWVEAQKAKDAADAAHASSKQGDLTSFYRNLLNVKEVGQSERDAKRAAEAEEKRKAEALEALKLKEAEEEAERERRVAALAAAAKAGPSDDQKEGEEKPSAEEGEEGAPVAKKARTAGYMTAEEAKLDRERIAKEKEEARKEALVRRNDESAVLSARERYLQRKAEQAAAGKK